MLNDNQKVNNNRTSLDQLEERLDAVLQIAQLLLRRKDVQKLLQTSAGSQNVNFWRAFFQVVLAHPFGIVTPGVSEWLKIAKELDKYRLEEVEQDPYSDSNNRGYISIYTVAQFWNADDIRAAAFVVRSDSKFSGRNIKESLPLQDSALDKVRNNWHRRWELMDAVNKLHKSVSSSNEQLSPTSIGNFVVLRSTEMEKACLPFQLHIEEELNAVNFKMFLKSLNQIFKNGDLLPKPEINTEEFKQFFKLLKNTLKYSEINFEFLEVPVNIFNAIINHLNQFSRVQENNLKDEAFFIHEIINRELWNDEKMYHYMLYMCCFIRSNYYPESEVAKLKSTPDAIQLRLILLNNLRIVHPLKWDEDKMVLHYQYCIPVWNKSASYLFVVTPTSLQKRELRAIIKFAEQLFGLAWVYDSLRKLEKEKRAFILQAERAARAAILARNFSHTVGSHVLNSPGFARTLTLGQDSTDLIKKLVDLENSIKNEILGNSQAKNEELFDNLDTVKKVIDRFSLGQRTSQDFFKFLQGRFDFIARAIEDYRPSLEPVFFVKEFLDGFLVQNAFLDHLVKDLGWGFEDMEFQLFLPHPENEFGTAIFKSKLVGLPGSISLEWHPESDISIDECAVLVGSPGGTIGAHAFYSILENLMRNSFKYGFGNRDKNDKNKFEDYKLYIRISKLNPIGCWQVYLWDNFSVSGKLDDPDSTISIITNRLKESIIDINTGELIPEGLGIQEMKICAENLKPIRINNSNEELLGLIDPSEMEQECNEAFEPNLSESKQPLVYKLTLEEPVLLAIYSEHSSSENDNGWIRRFTTLSEIADSGAHIAIIPDDLVDAHFLEEFGKIHSSLPFRIFVLCKSDKHKTKTETYILNSAIPKRRLHCYSENKPKIGNQRNRLYKYIRESATSAKVRKKNKKSKFDLEKDLICHAYEVWLCAWKGIPYGGKWHLWIGLDRSNDSIQTTWGKWLSVLTETSKDSIHSESLEQKLFNSDLISIIVRNRDASSNYTSISKSGKEFAWLLDKNAESTYWQKEKNNSHANKRALVFDNHGECFQLKSVEVNPDFHKSTRFYQKTGGGQSFALFQSLASPPTELFSFNFFVYALVESCLITVGVIDERVVSKVLLSENNNKKQNFLKGLAEFQKVGIFPLFQLRPTTSKEIAYYSPRHRVALEKEISRYNDINLLFHEGLQWNDKIDEFEIKVVAAKKSGQSLYTDNINFDFLIIHEGVLDILRSNYKLKWTSEMTECLFKIVPSVIRTSGRGHHSPNIGSWIPFLEATELSASLVTSLDKYKLSRALLGTSGDNKEKSKLNTSKIEL